MSYESELIQQQKEQLVLKDKAIKILASRNGKQQETIENLNKEVYKLKGVMDGIKQLMAEYEVDEDA